VIVQRSRYMPPSPGSIAAHVVDLPLRRIISGGQTGAGQAGLQTARRLGLATGGFMPLGFRTETGPRPDLAVTYGLEEIASHHYAKRTKCNVLLSDATVVFGTTDSPGSYLTVKLCRQLGKPCLPLPRDLAVSLAADRLRHWLRGNAVVTLNVAGNRESQSPGIGAYIADVLVGALVHR
jgi:hypothetical protein